MLRTLAATILLVLVSFPAFGQEPVMEHRFGPGPHFLQKKIVDYPRAKQRANRHVSRKHHTDKLARPVEIPQTHERVARYAASVIGSRPEGCPSRAWCGCWMAIQKYGSAVRHLWLAAKWAHEGADAHGPAPGVIAVWRHHVGEVLAYSPENNTILVRSGNDGRMVRQRWRAVTGVIAWRRV